MIHPFIPTPRPLQRQRKPTTLGFALAVCPTHLCRRQGRCSSCVCPKTERSSRKASPDVPVSSRHESLHTLLQYQNRHLLTTPSFVDTTSRYQGCTHDVATSFCVCFCGRHQRHDRGVTFGAWLEVTRASDPPVRLQSWVFRAVLFFHLRCESAMMEWFRLSISVS